MTTLEIKNQILESVCGVVSTIQKGLGARVLFPEASRTFRLVGLDLPTAGLDLTVMKFMRSAGESRPGNKGQKENCFSGYTAGVLTGISACGVTCVNLLLFLTISVQGKTRRL